MKAQGSAFRKRYEMYKDLNVILFILIAGISVLLTDVPYSRAADIMVPVYYPGNRAPALLQDASPDHDPRRETFETVHVWKSSKCGLCHSADDPSAEPMQFVMSDQSALCGSCHKGKITVLPNNGLSHGPRYLKNHPIKFSPFDFDPERINRNVISKDGSLYLSGAAGDIPIFGDSENTAVAECSTCHDPHGRSTVSSMTRLDNTEGDLCVVCHINISAGNM